MPKIFFFIGTFFLLCLSYHAETFETENIIGGKIAKINDYPYHVLLQTQDIYCNGAIISEWHVITAAHCVTEKDGSTIDKQIVISAGFNSMNDSSFKFMTTVDKVYVDRDFDPVNNEIIFEADIAVLTLVKKIPLNDYNLKTVELPELIDNHNFETLADKEAIITGFGPNKIAFKEDTNNKVKMTLYETGTLRSAEARILSYEECMKYPLYKKLKYRRMLCARTEKPEEMEFKGPCLGDSGGPFVMNINGTDTMIGILSYGSNDCDEYAAPSIYIRVGFYRDFIDWVLAK